MPRGALTLVTLAALLATSRVDAGEVISHPTVQLSPAEVRDVYLGERQWLSSLKLVPVDNIAAHDQFLAKVLQTDAPKYAARWLRKSFREGIAAPPVMGSDAEVIAFVKSTPGAIGYVSTPSSGVKVLHDF